jgi:hypothetical protein
MSLAQTPPGLPLTRRSPRWGSLVGGSRRGSTLLAKGPRRGAPLPPQAGHAWSTLVHTPSEPSGSQRSPAVHHCAGHRCDPGETGSAQNPDGDEVGGSVSPTPTTRLDLRKLRSPGPTCWLDGACEGSGPLPGTSLRHEAGAWSLVRSGSHEIALIGIDLGSPWVRSSGEGRSPDLDRKAASL